MAVVAPIAACGALVPVVAALLRGQPPRRVASLGLGAAVGGLLLLSSHRHAPRPLRSQARRALLLALGAALGYGLFLLLVGQASGRGGGVPVWTVAGARIGALVLLAGLARVGPVRPRWPGRQLAPVAALGLLDALGLLCFALAAGRGNVGIAAVLSSLGPAVTVVLGRVVLGERVSRIQGGGIILALCGVLLLSAS
jgi:drug/metabolite transporter (DMT)-like permease